MKALIIAAALASSLAASTVSVYAAPNYPNDNRSFNAQQFWQSQADRDG
ncbi:MAG: hypothetical protein AB7O43_05530 [Hyphomicrobiaceae bacterium]